VDAAKARRYVFADQIVPRPTLDERYQRRLATKDGMEVLARPLRATDEQKMSDLFYRLSDRSVYTRWMTVVPRMPHHRLQRYLDVDDTDNVAIVVEHQPDGAESELVGVARYGVTSEDGFADVAFIIRDDWQGKGLATALLAHLVEIARDNGIPGFVADVMATNAPMLHVFRRSGLTVETKLEGTSLHMTMPFRTA
jgi:RimJ/RimL family protein N-acetyltransferase